MEHQSVRVEEIILPAAADASTLGYWFYFGFYASPAMLVELETRTD